MSKALDEARTLRDGLDSLISDLETEGSETVDVGVKSVTVNYDDGTTATFTPETTTTPEPTPEPTSPVVTPDENPGAPVEPMTPPDETSTPEDAGAASEQPSTLPAAGMTE